MTHEKNKIVVCTDFSTVAQHAFEESTRLAKIIDADIYLVHIYGEKRDTKITAEKRLEKIAKAEEKKLEGIKIHYRVGEKKDGIVESLNGIVAGIEPNYFVVGYELKTGMNRFFGPNIMKIARGTKFPVIAIKEDENLDGINTIIYPLNLWDYARQKMNATIRLAQDFNAEVKVITLNVNYTDEGARKLKIHASNALKKFKEYGVDATYDALEGENEVNLVVDYANQHNADLIAKVFHHNPSFIDRITGDQDEEVLAKTNMPLFIVKSASWMTAGPWSPMRW